MNPPAITLEVLPAGYGDCLLISCPVGKRTWRLQRPISDIHRIENTAVKLTVARAPPAAA